MTETQSEWACLVERVRSEFVEMPGLAVTPAQAAKLWGLDEAQSERVIACLVTWGFLRRSRAGVVSRAA